MILTVNQLKYIISRFMVLDICFECSLQISLHSTKCLVWMQVQPHTSTTCVTPSSTSTCHLIWFSSPLYCKYSTYRSYRWLIIWRTYVWILHSMTYYIFIKYGLNIHYLKIQLPMTKCKNIMVELHQSGRGVCHCFEHYLLEKKCLGCLQGKE